MIHVVAHSSVTLSVTCLHLAKTQWESMEGRNKRLMEAQECLTNVNYKIITEPSLTLKLGTHNEVYQPILD